MQEKRQLEIRRSPANRAIFRTARPIPRAASSTGAPISTSSHPAAASSFVTTRITALPFRLPGRTTSISRTSSREPPARLEHAFDRYSRSQDLTDLKTCISKASNYAEGLASATNGSPGTLGALSNQIGDWPHDKVKESLQSLYKFCSDYPGIRHAGSPAGRRRDLEKKDAFLISLLLIVFSGYLTTNLNSEEVLGM